VPNMSIYWSKTNYPNIQSLKTTVNYYLSLFCVLSRLRCTVIAMRHRLGRTDVQSGFLSLMCSALAVASLSKVVSR
jgi:hypothetical protein